ncbi:MAG: hypothetical protein E6G28_01255 [Actinobacteria bacterium]|nr:MAG: hypothetical protein E6G28_01255 [Actinomycetota bacterium]
MAAVKMIFLGFGKYARADKIYALEPIVGEERGPGSRTLVWVDGIEEVVADVRRRRSRAAMQHPQLFEE